MVNLTPSLWALWKHFLQLEFDEEHRENETVEFTWRRPLKGDSFPPNTSTLWLKPPLTFLPSVDSNVRQNTVHCCTVWLILRYSWHESTWIRSPPLELQRRPKRAHPSDAYKSPCLAPGRVTNLNYLQEVSCSEISGSIWERWSTAGDCKEEEKMNQKIFFPPLNYPAKFLGSNLRFASWSCKYIITLKPRQGSSGLRTKCNTLV